MAYMRRKRFEAQFMALAVMQAMGLDKGDGKKHSFTPPTDRKRKDVEWVSGDQMWAKMGLNL